MTKLVLTLLILAGFAQPAQALGERDLQIALDRSKKVVYNEHQKLEALWKRLPPATQAELLKRLGTKPFSWQYEQGVVQHSMMADVRPGLQLLTRVNGGTTGMEPLYVTPELLSYALKVMTRYLPPINSVQDLPRVDITAAALNQHMAAPTPYQHRFYYDHQKNQLVIMPDKVLPSARP